MGRGALQVISPPAPAWQLDYRGQNISGQVESYVTAVKFEDKIEHAASTIEVTFEDRERLWQGPWYPQQGDVLALSIGYAGAPLVSCGEFQVQQIDLGGPPDQVTMSGISAYITPDMRTHRSRAFEGQTLSGLAQTVADTHGLTLVSAPVDDDVTLRRVTQKHETDLQFLRRMANLYGYNFSIRGQQLVFVPRQHLEQQATVAAVRRTDCMRFKFSDGTHRLYKSTTVSYTDPATKRVVTQTVDADEPVPTGDSLVLPMRAESGPDALAKATAALHANNMRAVEAKLSVVGNPLLMAGVTIDVTGFGKFDGKYLIEQADHTLKRTTGYDLDLSMRQADAGGTMAGGGGGATSPEDSQAPFTFGGGRFGGTGAGGSF